MDRWGEQVGREEERKSKCLYLSRGDNHDMTPFLMLRLPCLMTLCLPLCLRGLHTPHPLERGYALQVGGLRQGGSGGCGNPLHSWRGNGAQGSGWWCDIWSEGGGR
jgi:hypothetical protein